MRELATTAAELAGAVAITVGVALVSVPAALVVGGALAIGFGWRAAE
jgi:hypothetical protein